MDKPIWDLDFVYNGAQTVRVSCHPCINGSRAFCNMIGDQPLFYIDDAQDDDELLFLEGSEFDMDSFPADEKFMADMKAKLAAYDRAAVSLSNYQKSSTEEDFDQLFSKDTKEILSLDDLLDFGRQSQIFTSYLHHTQEHGIDVITSTAIETSFYSKDNSTILVNPHQGRINGCTSLLRSMRQAWHHKQGVLLNPLSFQPEEAILINRLYAVDADIAVVAFLWDLKLAGEEDIWAKAMSSSSYDLCSAYAMEAMTDFRSIKSGLAARAAFDKWFLSGRCKNLDRDIIQIMMGGHTDFEIDNRAASRTIAADIIAGLGNRPEGQNYLVSIMSQIMNDTLYAEVRDRSNANFLWFVTFERRMSEVEEEIIQRETNDVEENNILELPQSSGISGSSKPHGDMASIFFLDHFRAI